MLTTNRTIIRPYELEDAQLFYSQVQADYDYLADYFFNLTKSASSLVSIKEYIKEKSTDWNENIAYACGIFQKDTLHHIGHISVREIDWRVPKGEIGYFIFRHYAGNNYASEALSAFRDWCFTTRRFKRLFMKIDPSNLASIKVAEKSGFLLEGLLKKDYCKRERELVDMKIYGYTGG